MAVEKELVVKKLKESGLKLSNKLINDVAGELAPIIESEDKIADFLESPIAKVLLKQTEAEGNRRAEQAAATVRKEISDKVTGNEGQPPTTGTGSATIPDDAPPYMKQVFEFMQTQGRNMETLTQTVAGMQQAGTQKSIEQQWMSDDRVKGIDPFYFEGRIPTKAEDYETAMEKFVTGYTELANKLQLGKFGKDLPPATGGATGGSNGGGSGKVDLDVVGFAKKKNDAALANATK